MRLFTLLMVVSVVGCGGKSTPEPEPVDAGADDGGALVEDAGLEDAGVVDAGAPDAGQPATDGGACQLAPVTLTHDGPAPGLNIVRFLDQARYPDTVCNDGTPAAYFLRRGTGDAARRWVIYLEGGGSCLTPEGCAARPQSLSSTAGINRQDGETINLGQGGVASADPTVNPDFYDATTVQLNYCSSDLWSGDVGATPGAPETDLRHWHFRGKRIVRAVIAELLRREGLDTAREVFFMGSSAGGAGTVANIDETRAALPSSIRFVGLVDGIYGVPYAPYDSSTGRESTTLPPTTGSGGAERLAAWQASGDESCAARFGALSATCNVVPQLLASSEIATPLFVVDSQMDSNQLGTLGLNSSAAPGAQGYAQRYAAAKRAVFPTLSPSFALFSFFTTEHVIVNSNGFWSTAAVDGVTLRDAVGAWYRDPCSPPVKRVALP